MMTKAATPGCSPRKKTSFVIASLICTVALAWFISRRDGPAALEAEEIDMVLIFLKPWRGDPPTSAVSSNQRAAISQLVEALRRADAKEDHKCSSRGTIALVPMSGPLIQMEFLPGHEDEWYEVRFEDQAYRIPRAPFVNAMANLGVKIPLECL